MARSVSTMAGYYEIDSTILVDLDFPEHEDEDGSSGSEAVDGMFTEAPQLRFEVGTFVMCNMGGGRKLGRVIALHYREEGWPPGQVAPYQVALEGDHSLIFVPEDDERYCRQATEVDMRIERNVDALAPARARPTPKKRKAEEAAEAGAAAEEEEEEEEEARRRAFARF